MDLLAAVIWNCSQGSRLCPKTPAEYCIANNLYLYCESSSHILPLCCLAPALNTSATSNTATNAAGLGKA